MITKLIKEVAHISYLSSSQEVRQIRGWGNQRKLEEALWEMKRQTQNPRQTVIPAAKQILR